MLAFVTIGSTRFDDLVQSVFSPTVLSSLLQKGYTHIVVQCGNSEFPYAHLLAGGEELFQVEKEGVSIECWKFKPSLQMDYDRADLVISHAGSGTILDVLRLEKPLIVVPNPTLLDNHQEELAFELQKLGHLESSTVSRLTQTIQEFDPSGLVKFPSFDGSKFANLLDEEMGFL
ncbi:glycosyl transferase [Rhodocollybia butyracea]|uniref:UDP-N-acetylglucosamine transferase subunit ALG13 n=1 Tax=Rhodocollybia butyracea TaxID=206335 RepID=A0A9P5PWK9_9AGAR|nr:glycosyl transferase [Rhodocollybia butyracea]